MARTGEHKEQNAPQSNPNVRRNWKDVGGGSILILVWLIHYHLHAVFLSLQTHQQEIDALFNCSKLCSHAPFATPIVNQITMAN